MKYEVITRCAFAAAMLLSINPAGAVEGGVFGGPIGGTDIGQAYLPPVPGLYGAAVFLNSMANSYQDQNGNSTLSKNSLSAIGNPGNFTATLGGLALMYVYPFKPMGFTLASTFQTNYQAVTQTLTVGKGNVFLHGQANGFGDSYTDLVYASRYIGLLGAVPGNSTNPRLKYGLTMAFGLAAQIPLGPYNYLDFVTTGKNTFMLMPNVAATYLTGPNLALFGADGTEFSVRVFYDFLYQNPTTLYKSGNLYDIDFAVSQRWGNVQLGVAGAYAQQLDRDICGGVTSCGGAGAIVSPYGNKMEKFFLGPVLGYYWKEQDLNFKVKATFGIHNQNTYLNNTIVFSVAKKLW